MIGRRFCRKDYLKAELTWKENWQGSSGGELCFEMCHKSCLNGNHSENFIRRISRINFFKNSWLILHRLLNPIASETESRDGCLDQRMIICILKCVPKGETWSPNFNNRISSLCVYWRGYWTQMHRNDYEYRFWPVVQNDDKKKSFLRTHKKCAAWK